MCPIPTLGHSSYKGRDRTSLTRTTWVSAPSSRLPVASNTFNEVANLARLGGVQPYTTKGTPSDSGEKNQCNTINSSYTGPVHNGASKQKKQPRKGQRQGKRDHAIAESVKDSDDREKSKSVYQRIEEDEIDQSKLRQIGLRVDTKVQIDLMNLELSLLDAQNKLKVANDLLEIGERQNQVENNNFVDYETLSLEPPVLRKTEFPSLYVIDQIDSWYMGDLDASDIKPLWVRYLENAAYSAKERWMSEPADSFPVIDSFMNGVVHAAFELNKEARLIAMYVAMAEKFELRAYPTSVYYINNDTRCYEDRAEKLAKSRYMVLQPYIEMTVRDKVSGKLYPLMLKDPSWFNPMGLEASKRWNVLSSCLCRQFRSIHVNESLYSMIVHRRVSVNRSIDPFSGFDRFLRLVENSPSHQDNIDYFKYSGRSVTQETIWMAACAYHRTPFPPSSPTVTDILFGGRPSSPMAF